MGMLIALSNGTVLNITIRTSQEATDVDGQEMNFIWVIEREGGRSVLPGERYCDYGSIVRGETKIKECNDNIISATLVEHSTGMTQTIGKSVPLSRVGEDL